MELRFDIGQVEQLVDYTHNQIRDGSPVRDSFAEPGLILASQYGAGVYLMTGMFDEEWTSRLVFAKYCDPNADDFLDEIATAAYGTEETAELIPLETVERCLVAAQHHVQTHISIARTAIADTNRR